MKKLTFTCLSLTILFALSVSIQAQTGGFTYQGRFTDSTVTQPTNGTYSMQFALFDAASGGTQVGATVTNPTVQVTNGIFTVNLDFGANSFDGAGRFLEITVSNTVLSPRQPLTSAPYSIRSLSAANADTLDGMDSSEFVTGNVVRSVNGLNNNVTISAGSNITITLVPGNNLSIRANLGPRVTGFTTQRSGLLTLNPNSVVRVALACSVGVAINGGFTMLDHDTTSLGFAPRFTYSSNGSVDGDTSRWVVIIRNDTGNTGTGHAYVICAALGQ